MLKSPVLRPAQTIAMAHGNLCRHGWVPSQPLLVIVSPFYPFPPLSISPLSVLFLYPPTSASPPPASLSKDLWATLKKKKRRKKKREEKVATPPPQRTASEQHLHSSTAPLSLWEDVPAAAHWQLRDIVCGNVPVGPAGPYNLPYKG